MVPFLLVGAEYGHFITLWRLCALGKKLSAHSLITNSEISPNSWYVNFVQDFLLALLAQNYTQPTLLNYPRKVSTIYPSFFLLSIVFHFIESSLRFFFSLIECCKSLGMTSWICKILGIECLEKVHAKEDRSCINSDGFLESYIDQNTNICRY